MLTTRVLTGIALLVCLAGCGRGLAPAAQLRTSEAAYTEAMEALEEKDYATALERFEAAIQEAGLNADLFAEALLRSAECHVELGNLDAATEVLESLADHAPDMDRYHLVCCKLYLKQGDSAKARAAYEAARQINPAAEPPVPLR